VSTPEGKEEPMMSVPPLFGLDRARSHRFGTRTRLIGCFLSGRGGVPDAPEHFTDCQVTSLQSSQSKLPRGVAAPPPIDLQPHHGSIFRLVKKHTALPSTFFFNGRAVPKSKRAHYHDDCGSFSEWRGGMPADAAAATVAAAMATRRRQRWR